jgi:hypothetical protein
MIIMNTGRNDPCPCGSAKKYKKCCLADSEAQRVEDLSYRRLREIENKLIRELLRYASDTFGPPLREEAWDEFHCWKYTDGYDPKSMMNQLVGPYYLYCWEMAPFEAKAKRASRHKTIAESFLESNSWRLSSEEIKIIESANRSVFSFYEVTDLTAGYGFTLRNVLTEEVFEVKERLGSKEAKRGDIIYGALFEFNGEHQILAMSPFSLPPLVLQDLINVRKKMLKALRVKKLSNMHLFEYEFDLRSVYFILLQPILNPKMPEIRNTDGDPLVPQTLYFEIDDLEFAFQELKSLTHGYVSEEQLRSEAKYKNERIVEIEFPWFKKGKPVHGPGSNILLGRLKIVGNKLTVEVNSNKRAATIQKKILAILGDRVRFKTKMIESIEGNLDKVEPPSTPKSLSLPDEKMPPALKEAIKKMAEEHWKKWYSEKIPALNNKTPIQASKSKEGRELLEALLNSYEQRSANSKSESNDVFKPDFAQLRAKLGLEADQ